MLKSILCDYSDAYILVKGNITVNNTGAAQTLKILHHLLTAEVK